MPTAARISLSTSGSARSVATWPTHRSRSPRSEPVSGTTTSPLNRLVAMSLSNSGTDPQRR
ncbi:hypothetical protein [Streptomyces hainanensis]|uniref:hypothetical protein n=1 Tax=Streptomyces hainanensis TaxID=402648 RepID=UPI003132B4EC